MAEPDNPQAFPVPGEDCDGYHPIAHGMDLRDYFAAKAMQAFLHPEYPYDKERTAADAYEIADEMLLARSR